MCVATPQAELLLPASRISPAAARDWARRSGCQEHSLALLDDALLLISELVTNAVLHGGPPILLAIDCDGEGLRVRVRDGSPVPPTYKGDVFDAKAAEFIPDITDPQRLARLADVFRDTGTIVLHQRAVQRKHRNRFVCA